MLNCSPRACGTCDYMKPCRPDGLELHSVTSNRKVHKVYTVKDKQSFSYYAAHDTEVRTCFCACVTQIRLPKLSYCPTAG